MKVEYLARLERTERMMVRWMYGVHLKSRMANSTVGLASNPFHYRCAKTKQTAVVWSCGENG